MIDKEAMKEIKRMKIQRARAKEQDKRCEEYLKNKIKVVCVYGKFEKGSDFVLEPPCSDDCECEMCKDAFWIRRVE